MTAAEQQTPDQLVLQEAEGIIGAELERILEQGGLEADNEFVQSPAETEPSERNHDVEIARAKIRELEEAINEQQRQHQAETQKMVDDALIDKMTGMPNREAYVSWMDQRIAENPENLRAGFLDMDRLKQMNDTYGHEVADNVIKRIGTILTSHVREGEDMIAAHRSGDEFLFAINGADRERVEEVSKGILKDINSIGLSPNGEIVDLTDTDIGTSPITASLGFAKYEEGMTTSDVMQAADFNMMAAKEAGRNQYMIDLPMPDAA